MGSHEEKLEDEQTRDGVASEMAIVQSGLCLSSPTSGCLSEDQLSVKSDEFNCVRIKLMCSYGGRILPRPQDGQLRYIGGETRIVVVDRNISLAELSQRMNKLAGKPMLIKYQLPGEDLDALISVKTDEDLDNMMDEHEKLLVRDSSSRLRVFLFPLVKQRQQQSGEEAVLRSKEQHFLEALNSLPMSVEHEEICHHHHQQHYLEGQADKFRHQQHHRNQHFFGDEGCIACGYHQQQQKFMVGSPPQAPTHKLPLPPARSALVESVCPLDHHKGMVPSSSRSPTRRNGGHEEPPRSPGMSPLRFRELQQPGVGQAMAAVHEQQQPQQLPHYRLPGGGYHYYKF